MAQYLFILVVIAVAVAYAGYRVWLAVRQAGDPCYGCPGCALKDRAGQQNRRLASESGECMKKTAKKFGRTK